VGLTVGLYCICSGGMLVINKVTVAFLGVPALITISQFAATSLGVLLGAKCGLLTVDPCEWSKIRHFGIYVLAFSGGTWSNMKVLMVSNVETVIVFRACAPLIVCMFDYHFHRRALPSFRSIVAMLLIGAGAICYVVNDRSFRAEGPTAYFWVLVWFSLLVFQLTYAKHLVTGIGLKSVWSSVLYTNTLAIVPTALIGIFSGDFSQISRVEWSMPGIAVLMLSCCVGMGISFAGFKCQQLITATAYTVVGVMNKMLTVTINVMIWDKHASGIGIASLCVCLLGGSLYQQAPPRAPAVLDKRGAYTELTEPEGASTPRKEEGSTV